MSETTVIAPSRGTTVSETGLVRQTETTAELQTTRDKQQVKAEIEAMIVMARHFPRNVDQAIVNINKLCSRPRFADGAFYQFPRGGTSVEGPSVNLARGIAAEWGNIKYGKRVIRDDGEEVTIEAFAWDMERNSYVTDQASFKSLVQRKIQGQTKWVKPDERDKRELVNKHGAISERNCLLKILPRDVVDQAFDLCKDTVKNRTGKDREESIRNMLVAFSQYGVEKDQLEWWLADRRDSENAEIRSINADEMVALKGILTSVEDGNSTPSEHFKPRKTGSGLSEKGALDTSKMKAGNGATNAGHDNAPKPETKTGPPDMNDTGKRIWIQSAAMALSDNDAAKSADLLNDWTGGQTLIEMEGDDLQTVYQIAFEKRRVQKGRSA